MPGPSSKFGEQGITDMVGRNGYYTLISMVLNTARTPLPKVCPGAGAFPSRSGDQEHVIMSNAHRVGCIARLAIVGSARRWNGALRARHLPAWGAGSNP